MKLKDIIKERFRLTKKKKLLNVMNEIKQVEELNLFIQNCLDNSKEEK